MTRIQATTYLRIAGYHDDRAAFTRLYVENRISLPAAKEAYRSGQQAKKVGVRCDCNDCKGAAS
jgi:hypothetical protein